MAKFQAPFLGAAYYPEDWPMSMMQEDIALMKQAGMNVMRVGEFAWSKMEPAQGKFDFAWLHQVVDELGKNGIATIMCTPTCTPPAWMIYKYPQIASMQEDGRRAQHGSRRHACYNDPKFRELCTIICEKLASEFANDENIVGWQIDNELSPWGPTGCGCPVCQDKFKEKMKNQFGSIENLNETWGTYLWSQNYDSFDQLPVPPRSNVWHHPSLKTAWTVFVSDSLADFCTSQALALKKGGCKTVGTDMMPYGLLSYQDTHRELDLVQFNHYNTMDNLWQSTFWMNYCRPQKAHPFWNTETSTCWNGSVNANGYREEGFCRINSLIPIALGGEANLYWLWRAHWSGQELMHGSVVTSQGRPLHIFSEVQGVADLLQKGGEFLRGTKLKSQKVALHYSHKAWAMFEHQPMVNGFKYHDAIIDKVYGALFNIGVVPDVIAPEESLEGYDVVITPFLPCLEEGGLRERAKTFVENGGTWLVGPMSDCRDMHATKYKEKPFSVLEDWCDIYTEMQIPGDPVQFSMLYPCGQQASGSIWYDAFLIKGDASVIATYQDGPFAGSAAIVHKKMGKGCIQVMGTLPQGQGLMTIFEHACCDIVKVPCSANVLAAPREGAAGKGMMVLEVNHKDGWVQLAKPMKNIVTGEVLHGKIHVAPYDALLLQDM